MPKHALLLFLSFLTVFLALSCTPAVPPEEESTSYSLKGTIHDALNGDPIPGATIRYGDASSTTESDGAFTVDLGTTAGVFDRSLGISATGYIPRFITPVEVNAPDDNTYVLTLRPLTNVVYTPKQLHVTVFDGGTEITDATVGLGILPKNGLFAPFGEVAYAGGNYSFATRTYSADCIVLAVVKMSDPAQSFVVHMTGVDLSGPGPIDVSFTKPTTGTQDVTLTADSTDCVASGFFITPYGLINAFFKYETSSTPQLDSTVKFTDVTTKSVTAYNPSNWTCYWGQSKHDAAYAGTGYKLLISTSEVAAMPPTLTLPSLDPSIGPGADPNEASWTYNSASGTISIDTITATVCYQYYIVDPGSIARGIVVSLFSSTVTLPSWLNGTINDKSPLTIGLTPIGTDIAAYTMSMVALDNYPPGSKFGMLQATMDNMYVKSFTF